MIHVLPTLQHFLPLSQPPYFATPPPHTLYVVPNLRMFPQCNSFPRLVHYMVSSLWMIFVLQHNAYFIHACIVNFLKADAAVRVT